MTEYQLHVQVASYLNLALPPQTIWHHSPNEGRHKPQYYAKQKRLGGKKGWPDIEIIHRGRPVFIELKTEKGRVSQAQKERHEELILAGACVTICRSLEEVKHFVETAIV